LPTQLAIVLVMTLSSIRVLGQVLGVAPQLVLTMLTT
jgi:hypothetical protein